MRGGDRALMRAEQPALEQGDHAVHLRQKFGPELVLSSRERDPMAIAIRFQPVISVPPVGMCHAAALDRLVDIGLEAVRGRIGDPTHPGPPDARAHFFGHHHDQRFRCRRPALRPAAAARETLVDFHAPRKSIAPGPDHRSAQLVQPGPRCFVTPQPQEALQAQGAGSRLWLVTHHIA
jgi:hypothetical protein